MAENSPFGKALIAGTSTFLSLAVLAKLVFPTSCRDGWASLSIGRTGACSHHGGVSRIGDFLVFLAIFAAFYIGRSTYRRFSAQSDRKQTDVAPERGSTEVLSKPSSATPHVGNSANYLAPSRTLGSAEQSEQPTQRATGVNASKRVALHHCTSCGSRKEFVNRGSQRNPRRVYMCPKRCRA